MPYVLCYPSSQMNACDSSFMTCRHFQSTVVKLASVLIQIPKFQADVGSFTISSRTQTHLSYAETIGQSHGLWIYRQNEQSKWSSHTDSFSQRYDWSRLLFVHSDTISSHLLISANFRNISPNRRADESHCTGERLSFNTFSLTTLCHHN